MSMQPRREIVAVVFAVLWVGFSGYLYGLPRHETVQDARQGIDTHFSNESPFANISPLPYQAPPFDRIQNSDYGPAIQEGMRQQIAEIESISSNPLPPTFDNTIIALERSGVLLTRVTKIFFAIVSANTNDTLQKVQEEVAPRLAAHNDAIRLNTALFKRIDTVYRQRDSLHLDGTQRFLIQRYYKDFVRSGVLLSDAEKSRLRTLNIEESKLTTSFQEHLLAATKAGALVVQDRHELDGLSDAEISAAAEAAHQRGMDGMWVLSLQNTTQQPSQASLHNRTVRERLFIASTTRTEKQDSNDTRRIILRLAGIRVEKARLLGYPNYAAYVIADDMAKTPSAVIKLLTDLVPATTSKTQREVASMQSLMDREKMGGTLKPWDWQYYSEKVREERFAIDDGQIKPFFELNRVLHDGVFFAANQLYGLTFKERKDIPVYHPDVRTFEVFDVDGSSIGLWYCDYYKRDNKSGGAWEDTYVDGIGLLNTKPVVFNVLNIPKPEAGQPTFLTFDNVTTMFHEFGHALHALLTHVEYPRLAGTNVSTDFVEFPSQFNEHWALDSTVFKHFAKHYETGMPMPSALVSKIKAAKTFNQGFTTMEYIEASLLDMGWHTLSQIGPSVNVDTFEVQSLATYKVNFPIIPPRYRTTYFAHIWDGGYAAGYFAYLWSEVLDDDAFEWFTEHGGLTRANGQRFRDMILSRGGTEDPEVLYRAFRGRNPDVNALIQERGLTGE